MNTRTEHDSLGPMTIPADAYYGAQTARAIENFPVSGLRAHPALILAFVQLKQAAALANVELGTLDPKIGEAIITAADEVRHGALLDQFVVDVYQAGAGTSFNMNANEVLANRALEILGKSKGEYAALSPNDHVNMAQSTNDTFPTATHVALLMMHRLLDPVLGRLAEALCAKGLEFAKVYKLGRTHLQDAVPVTLGMEFEAYGDCIARGRRILAEAAKELEPVALGATAVGTGMNAHPRYRELAVKHLSELTGLPLRTDRNLREALQSHLPIAHFSGTLRTLAGELSRIASDLRLLCSGPISGLAEITLPAVQPGSSIMPGKINPSMPECLNMICFHIIGNDLTVSLAAQGGQLELNVFTPISAAVLLHSMTTLINFLPVFTDKCIAGITADAEKCWEYFERNPALATALNPHIGYLKAAKLAKESMARKKPVKHLAVEQRLITEEMAEEIFNPERLVAPREHEPSRKRSRKKS